MKIKTEIRGLDDVNNLLENIAPKNAVNIMRSTVHAMASEVTRDAKKEMPEDTGDMRELTKARRERVRFGRVASTVRVSTSAFYWRFLEYGDGPDGVEYGFFMRAVRKMQVNMHNRFLVIFGKKFEASLARARKRFG